MGESYTDDDTTGEPRRFQIGGMHCTDCESRVANALLTIDGVDKVITDLERGEVMVYAAADVDDEALLEAVAASGYTIVFAESAPPQLEAALESEPPLLPDAASAPQESGATL